MVELVKEIKKKLEDFANFNILLNIMLLILCLVTFVKVIIIETEVHTISNTIQQFYIDAEDKQGCIDSTNISDVWSVEYK